MMRCRIVDEDYLQVAFTVNWESDGSTLNVKFPANNDVVTSFFDRDGTTVISRTMTNKHRRSV